MTGGLLGNLWHNKGAIFGDFLNFGDEKKEAKLGDDINYGLLAKNFFPDMKETGQELKTIVDDPALATKSLLEVVGGAIGKQTPEWINVGLKKVAPDNLITSERTQKMASDAWADIVSTHGSIDGFKKFAQENPFEAMLELTGVGLVARQVKNATAPTVLKAIAEAERNGLMDQIRKVGSLPVGLSMKDVSKMSTSELKKYMASQEIYNSYLGKVDPSYVIGQPLSTVDDPIKLANLQREIVGQDQDLITPKTIKLKDLEGRVLMGFETDRTAAGGLLKKVNDFTVNTKLWGGMNFQLLKEMVKREDLWASDLSPLQKVNQQAELIKSLEGIGEYPLITQYIMQGTGSNFAHMTQQLMMEVLQETLPKRKLNKLNKEIKKLVPDWKGIHDVDLSLELSKLHGSTRKKIGTILGRSEFADEGLSLAETGLALTEEGLMGAPRGQISGLIGELEPTMSKRIMGGSLHPSYPYSLKGHNIGKLDEPNLNIFDLLKYNDLNMQGRSYNPNKLRHEDFRSAQLNPPSWVQITDKVLRDLENTGKIK
jgi:hypothetical protein